MNINVSDEFLFRVRYKTVVNASYIMLPNSLKTIFTYAIALRWFAVPNLVQPGSRRKLRKCTKFGTLVPVQVTTR